MSPQTGVWGGRGTRWELLQGVRLFFPQNDPDKEYNMPKDGTVHELTSNVGAALGLLGRGGGAGGRMDCKVLHAPSRQGLSQETKPTGWSRKLAATLFTGQAPGPAPVLGWSEGVNCRR